MLRATPSGRFGRGVSLLCWAYNEEASILEFLERATRLMDEAVEDYEIVLVDDGSTDRTFEIAAGFAAKNPGLRIFRNEKNLNVGLSSRKAIRCASKEFLFWQTIDWSYEISDLRTFLGYLDRYDIVQGTRARPVRAEAVALGLVGAVLELFSLENLARRSDSMPKALVSVCNYILIRILFGVPLSDYQNVTFYPTKFIQSIDYESTTSFANPEGLIKSYWKGMSIKEVPIGFARRTKGSAKGTRLRSIFNSVVDVFSLWFKWVLLGRRDFVRLGKVDRLAA